MAGNVNLEGQPGWFTPERLLFILCMVNLLNYLDRGAIASNGVNGNIGNSTCDSLEGCYRGTGIQGDFGLSNFEDGVLSSAFMVGLLLASPIFAHLAKTHNPFKLMGVGLFVWTFATAMCGFSIGFWSITIARMLVGVGEASFISLAAPFVVDNAPPDKKTEWLSVFYMCIPVGMALGYVYGGVIGGLFSWRVAFWMEAVFMLPCALIAIVSDPIQMKGVGTRSELGDVYDPTKSTSLSIEDGGKQEGDKFRFADESSKDHGKSTIHSDSLWQRLSRCFNSFITHSEAFLEDIKTLFRSRVYTINVLGSIAYNSVLGAYSYWGPRAGYAIFNLEKADLVFGGMTVVCGIFGTLAGGIILDKIGSTILNGFKLLAIATFVGGVACFVSFLSRTLKVFLPLFALGELFIFSTQGPVNYLILQSVSTNLRPLAMAVSTVCIHVFGDVPSSPVVGALQDYLEDWRLTTLILTSVFFLAALIWFSGVFIPSEHQGQFQDIFIEENQIENSEHVPLLAKS